MGCSPSNIPSHGLSLTSGDSPLYALNVSTRVKLALYLDMEGTTVTVRHGDNTELQLLNDYTGLAELAGFDSQQIRNLKVHTL